MEKIEICPGCGRQCNLNDPQCERGKEYLRTGELPEKRRSKGHDHKKHMQDYHTADINDKLVINFRKLSHMMCKQHDGKASQKRILSILNESGTLTQKELTECLGIQPGSASELLSKLENAGLITRTPNASDHRTTDVQLTEKGTALGSEAVDQRKKRHNEMFTCLSAEEQETLLALLEKLHHDWEQCFSSHHDHEKHEHHCKEHHKKQHVSENKM